MRSILIAAAFTGAAFGFSTIGLDECEAAQPAAKAAPKDTRAAEFTRDRYLKVKVTGEFKDVPLREVLKEFAIHLAPRG